MFTVRQTEEFVAWLDALKDKRAQIRIAARLRQAVLARSGGTRYIFASPGQAALPQRSG